MLVMFAAGVATLWWMAVLTALMVFEKTAQAGRARRPDRGHRAARMGRARADPSGMAAAAVRRPGVAADELRARRRALALLAIALVLAMTTWFSATAVIPQLRAEWDLSRTSAVVADDRRAARLRRGRAGLERAQPQRRHRAAARDPRRRARRRGGEPGAARRPTGPGGALPARFATGFFLAGVYPPALKLMATWFRENRGVALGVLVGALTLGSATPHLVNGAGGLDWQLVVAVTSLLTLAGGADRVRVRPRRAVPVPEGGVRPAPGAARARQPRCAARVARLLRAHVGALRDVGVVRGLLPRRARLARRRRRVGRGVRGVRRDRRRRARLLRRRRARRPLGTHAHDGGDDDRLRQPARC